MRTSNFKQVNSGIANDALNDEPDDNLEVQKYSLEDKIRFITGDGAWHTKTLDGKHRALYMTDGPHGLRRELEGQNYMGSSSQDTCFPTASCLASSWDTKVTSSLGEALAYEAINRGVDILLGPGINIKRTPACGRNFEYFSEDPLLTASLASTYVEALQTAGVGASLKHFAVNNQESRRHTQNSMVDERALREIYLWAFEDVITKHEPYTVMASYNRINGEFACENKWLLDEILRKEWQYEGVVVSDWGASVFLPRSVEAGMDLEMPDSLGIHAVDLAKAIHETPQLESKLDQAFTRVLALHKRCESMAKTRETILKTQNPAPDLARVLAEKSMVLLKNDGILPLQNKELIVIGDMASPMRFQGGGSSRVEASRIPDAIKTLESRQFKFEFARGYKRLESKRDDALEEEAIFLAKRNLDCPILFFGGLSESLEGEGYDRLSFAMPNNQQELLLRLLDLGAKVILISTSGAPYQIPYTDRLAAIMQTYLAGQFADVALINLLCGEVSPSGRLAETWPIFTKQYVPPYFNPLTDDTEYRESIFIGYRYYQTFDKAVAYPFGYGLSYATFAYHNLSVSLEDKNLLIEVEVENTSTVSAEDVIQIYVRFPDANFMREKYRLIGFDKLALGGGEIQKLRLSVPIKNIKSFWQETGKWVLANGTYTIVLGRYAGDACLAQDIIITGDELNWNQRNYLPNYFTDPWQVDQGSFRRLYGQELSTFDTLSAPHFSRRNTLNQLAKASFFAKVLRAVVKRGIYFLMRDMDKRDPQVQMMVEGAVTGPIDIVIVQSKGLIPNRLANAAVAFANKQTTIGLKELFSIGGKKKYEQYR